MKVKLTHPLISCICITDNRPSLLLRAIVIFDAQTYPNREIVVSYPQEDQVTKQLIERIRQLSDLRILTIEHTGQCSLGMAKNEAIEKCNGDYICIWDDYNWFHINRLMHQYNTIQAKARFCEASILTRVTLYDEINHKAGISKPYNWGVSLLCKKNLVLKYPFIDVNEKEDNHLIAALEAEKLIYPIDDAATSFVLVYQKEQDIFQFSNSLEGNRLFSKEDTDFIYNMLNLQIDLGTFDPIESA